MEYTLTSGYNQQKCWLTPSYKVYNITTITHWPDISVTMENVETIIDPIWLLSRDLNLKLTIVPR